MSVMRDLFSLSEAVVSPRGSLCLLCRFLDEVVCFWGHLPLQTAVQDIDILLLFPCPPCL